LCTSRPCSVLVLLLVIVVSVLAFTGPTAIHLDRSQAQVPGFRCYEGKPWQQKGLHSHLLNLDLTHIETERYFD
jgi:hypothetical protein